MDDIPDFEKIFQKYDGIIMPPYRNLGNWYDEFVNYVYKPWIDDALEIMKVKFPEYYETAMKLKSCVYEYRQNIFIIKKEDFKKYGEFIFTILMDMDKKYNITNDEENLEYLKAIKKSGRAIINGTPTRRRWQAILIEKLNNLFLRHTLKNILEVKLVMGENEIKTYYQKNFIEKEYTICFKPKLENLGNNQTIERKKIK